MNVSHLAVLLITTVLPGMMSVQFFRRATGKRHASHWDYFVDIIVFSTVSYAILGLLCHALGVPMVVDDMIFRAAYRDSVSPALHGPPTGQIAAEITLATLIGMIFAIARAFVRQRRWLTRGLIRLGLSARSEDEDMWQYFLHIDTYDFDLFTIRDDEKGITYDGEVIGYSEPGRPRELVLHHVTVSLTDTGRTLYTMPRLYLSFPVDSPIVIEARTAHEATDVG